MKFQLIPLYSTDAGTGIVYHGVTRLSYDASSITFEQGTTIAWKALDPAHPMALIVTEEEQQ